MSPPQSWLPTAGGWKRTQPHAGEGRARSPHAQKHRARGRGRGQRQLWAEASSRPVLHPVWTQLWLPFPQTQAPSSECLALCMSSGLAPVSPSEQAALMWNTESASAYPFLMLRLPVLNHPPHRRRDRHDLTGVCFVPLTGNGHHVLGASKRLTRPQDTGSLEPPASFAHELASARAEPSSGA